MTTPAARSAAGSEPAAARGVDQTLRNRLRERAKLLVRGTLQRADLEISRGAHSRQRARILADRGLDTVLDIGANVGQYGSLTRSAGFDGRIISCEPLSGAFAELSRRAARDPKWTTLNTAVGDAPGSTTIHVSANSYSSSLLDMTEEHERTAPGSGYVATEEVPVTTVAALVDEHGIDPRRTLLKIDTQGYEPQVMAGAGDLLAQMGALQLELSFVELYAGQKLFDEVCHDVRELGFRWHALEPGYSAPDGRLMQVDGLFVRAADD